MNILCVSASNTLAMGENSASTKVCKIIKDYLNKQHQDEVSIEIIQLVDATLIPCILCGACAKTGKCPYDEAFNSIYAKIIAADGIYLVVPHYSTIPAKLTMIFEKINETLYAGWINEPLFQAPIKNKPIGIIGHGGMTENDKVLKYYHDYLITPIANTLRSLSFKVVGANNEFANGIPFCLLSDDCIKKTEDSIFPSIIHDWDYIGARIQQLIENVFIASANQE